MKKSYARITYVNCDLEYQRTVCEWFEVCVHIELAELENYPAFAADDPLRPHIVVEPVMMTEKEYGDYIEKYYIK